MAKNSKTETKTAKKSEQKATKKPKTATTKAKGKTATKTKAKSPKKRTVTSEFKIAVKQAIDAGLLDKKKHGALIMAAQKMAETMDRDGWPLIDGKFDNVTPSTFMKYCEALHITPADVPTVEPDNAIKLVGNSKWKKAVNEE